MGQGNAHPLFSLSFPLPSPSSPFFVNGKLRGALDRLPSRPLKVLARANQVFQPPEVTVLHQHPQRDEAVAPVELLSLVAAAGLIIDGNLDDAAAAADELQRQLHRK